MSFVGQRNTSTLFLSRLLVHSYFSTRVLARVIEGSIRVKTDTQFLIETRSIIQIQTLAVSCTFTVGTMIPKVK